MELIPPHRVKDLATAALAAEYFRARATLHTSDDRTTMLGIASRLDRLVAELVVEMRGS